jgi:uncharacterized ion transporter superfamily protein YfcC
MRKIEVSLRDRYLLLIGLFFAFFFQVFYDMIHEAVNFYNLTEKDWFTIQVIMALIFVGILIILIRSLTEEKSK